MPEDLESILRRVFVGELTPEEAEPLVAAATGSGGVGDRDAPLTARPAPPPPPLPAGAPRPPEAPRPPDPPGAASGAQRTVRLEVLEDGKTVVNLRIPVSLASIAGSGVPGLSGPNAERLKDAIRSGVIGRILEVQDEDGDGVIISTE